MERSGREGQLTAGSLLARAWPLALALGLLAALVGWALHTALALTGGHFAYALDDPYIHMAIAKNLVRHGVWGTTAVGGFNSATSSPVWTLILAASYWLFGVNEIAPLVLNLVFAVLSLVAIAHVFRKFSPSRRAMAGLLVAEIVCVPMVPVVLCGLEHFLHVTTAVVFVWLAAREDPAQAPRRAFWWLCLAGTAVASARYEGLFLVAGAVLLLLAGRRFARAAILTGAAWLPAIAYGVKSLAQGWTFWPASVQLKANIPAHGLPRLADIFDNWRDGLNRAPYLAVMILGGATLLAVRRRQARPDDPAGRMMLLTLIALVLHLSLAHAGYFCRYEAYLIALWILSLACLFSTAPAVPVSGLRHLLRAAAVPGVVAALALPALVGSGLFALKIVPRGCRSIFEQQIQMAGFVSAYYRGHKVAANDVGAINFYADLDNLDLVGLSSREVMWAHLNHEFTRRRIYEMAAARGMEIAIVYDDWYLPAGGLPVEWSKRGEWTIGDAVTSAEETVSFYAVRPDDVARLDASLRAFAPRLPQTVVQAGPYLAADLPLPRR
jgi:hypothetical protein